MTTVETLLGYNRISRGIMFRALCRDGILAPVESADKHKPNRFRYWAECRPGPNYRYIFWSFLLL